MDAVSVQICTASECTSRHDLTQKIGLRLLCSDALESGLAREVSQAMDAVSVQICIESECTSKQDFTQKCWPCKNRHPPEQRAVYTFRRELEITL
jgi:hypothetical protein